MTERVLCVAAHPDDEVLGCGATLALHAQAGDEVFILFCADGVGARDPNWQTKGGLFEKSGDTVPQSPIDIKKSSRQIMAKNALAKLGVEKFVSLDFPDNRLDQIPLLDLVQSLEVHIAQFNPTIIYTHHAGDLNIDHRRVCEAVLTAARPLPGGKVHSIFAFEVLSSTGWGEGAFAPFLPQVYVDVRQTLHLKLEALACYSGEMRDFPHARSFQSIEAAAVVRGSHVGLSAAEAFMLLRQIRIVK